MSVRSLGLDSRNALIFLGLFVLAVVVRLVFFIGPVGSDDLLYLGRAVEISKGIWTSSNYVGSLRYGFNIPAGFLIYLFGLNIFTANLWPLFCSVAEIAVVYVFALKSWGPRVALYSTLILVFLPLHVAAATRIHADSVVSCFLTLSFVLFYFAEQRRSPWLYYLTGMAMGFVFWTKEGAMVTLLAFAIYPFLWAKLDLRWGYVIAGGITMLLAHLMLMHAIAGNPLHVINVVARRSAHSFIQGEFPAEDGAWYYFRYLLLDIKHTWLSGIIAIMAILLVAGQRLRSREASPGTGYAVFWLVSLIGVLSFVPVSLEPLKFVMKQSNYMTLFLAPMALLAGYLLTRAPRKIGLMLLIATLGGGLFLSGLEQQAIRVFISNSNAAVNFARANSNIPVVGSISNGNIARVYSILDQDEALAAQFDYMSDIPRNAQDRKRENSPATLGYAVLDQETMWWGNNAVSLEQAPLCWEEIKHLVPAGFGLGLSFLKIIQASIEPLPRKIRDHIKPQLEKLAHPRLAVVYKVNMQDFWCEQE